MHSHAVHMCPTHAHADDLCMCMVDAWQARWEIQRERRQRSHEEVARQRVVEASALDARLDAQEEAVNERERQEGTAARLAMAEALRDVRSRELAHRVQVNRDVREQLHQVQVATQQPAQQAARCGEEKRQHSREWHGRRQQQEDEYLSKVRVRVRVQVGVRVRVKGQGSGSASGFNVAWQATGAAGVPVQGEG